MSKQTRFLWLFLACLCVGIPKASAQLVMIVSRDSKLESVTREGVSNFFTGKVKQIEGQQFYPVIVISGKSHDALLKTYIGMSAQQFTREWSKLVFTGKAKNPLRVASDTDLVKAVAGNSTLTGFVDPSAVTAEVRIVSIVQ